MGKSNLSQLVKRIIKQKGLSLRDVQRGSGGEIANSYISRIMNGGVKNLSVDKLVALARGLGEDPHLLFTAAYGRPPLSSDEPPGSSAMEAATLVDLMQRVVAEPQLAAIVYEAVELRREEYPVVLRYLTLMNEDGQKPKRSKKEKARRNGE